MNLDPKTKIEKDYTLATIIGIILAIIFLFWAFSASAGNESAQRSSELKTQAEANLQQALQLDCLRVHERQGICYQDNATCNKFWEAEDWFYSEWASEHLVTCTQYQNT